MYFYFLCLGAIAFLAGHNVDIHGRWSVVDDEGYLIGVTPSLVEEAKKIRPDLSGTEIAALILNYQGYRILEEAE